MPRWLDLRLVLGLLLVLGSVLVGARVVTAAGATVPVWSAARDLAGGTVLRSADLVAVDVRLDAAAGAYLSTRVSLEGRVLDRSVRRGELLPRSAVDRPRPVVQVALPVQAGFVPPSLTRGQLVDVYALAGSGGAANTTPPSPVTLVAAGVTVQELSARSSGVLSAPTATVQVVVSVPEERAAQVLGAISGRSLAVVVHQSVGDQNADAGPSGLLPDRTPSPTATAPASPAG